MSLELSALVRQPACTRLELLDTDVSVFRDQFNRADFELGHRLAQHPLFSLPRLQQAAARLIDQPGDAKLTVLGGELAGIGTKFNDIPGRERVADAVARIPTSRSWLKLSSLNTVDPEYDAVARQFIGEVEYASATPLAREISWYSLTVFLASPGIVTPYHIDHESNFLLQISGQKDVCLFDPSDRTVLPEHEIEAFYRGDNNAALYDGTRQSRGVIHRLIPGTGVHHPPLAPHWVRNGDAVSISASIGFCTRGLDRRAKIYQANYFLRKLHIQPRAPGLSPLGDRLKSRALELLSDHTAEDRDQLLFSGVQRLSSLSGLLRPGKSPPP